MEIENENLDLLAETTGLGGYDQVIGDAETMEVAGTVVKVLALSDLIQTKRTEGPPKDLAILPVLEATLREQQGR